MAHWQKSMLFGAIIFLIFCGLMLWMTAYDFYISQYYFDRAGTANTDEVKYFVENPKFGWYVCAWLCWGFASLIPFIAAMWKSIKWLILPSMVFFIVFAVTEIVILVVLIQAYKGNRDLHPIILQAAQCLAGITGSVYVTLTFVYIESWAKEEGTDKNLVGHEAPIIDDH